MDKFVTRTKPLGKNPMKLALRISVVSLLCPNLRSSHSQGKHNTEQQMTNEVVEIDECENNLSEEAMEEERCENETSWEEGDHEWEQAQVQEAQQKVEQEGELFGS
jgi:hypothetical protein